MKNMEMASATGRYARPLKKDRVAAAMSIPLAACSHRVGVSHAPRVHSNSGNMNKTWNRNRLAVTCPEETDPDSHFAIASIPGSISMARTIITIARSVSLRGFTMVCSKSKAVRARNHFRVAGMGYQEGNRGILMSPVAQGIPLHPYPGNIPLQGLTAFRW